MELRQLRFAVVLAEELHFGRAAAREHVAQSALSQQIQKLERELRVKLFDRSTHHVQLTDAGQLFVEESRRMLATVDELVLRTRRAADGVAESLRLGCVGYAQWWPQVRAVQEAFAAARPDVRLETVYLPPTGLLAQLREGRVDAALVNGQAADDTLASVSMVEMPVDVLLPADHPLADRAAVAVGDLAGQRLVLWPREVNPVVYDDMLRFFDRHEVAVSVVEVSQVSQAWLAAVAAGAGVALIAAANRLAYDGVVRRPFDGPAPALSVRLVWRRDQDRPAVAALAGVVRDLREPAPRPAAPDPAR